MQFNFSNFRYITVFLLILMAVPAAKAEINADEFNRADFWAEWEWRNEPPKWELKDGNLVIESDVNANLWATHAAAHLYQESKGDFDVETYFESTWETPSMVLGLVAYSEKDDNWVTLKIWGRDADAVIQYQAKEEALGPDNQGNPVGDWALFLRLKREKDTYTSYTKEKEKDAWAEYGQADFKLSEPLQVGIYAGIADPAGEMTTQFDYVRDALGEPEAVDARAKLATTWADLKAVK